MLELQEYCWNITVTAVLPEEMNKTAGTAVLPDKMNKASSMIMQTMTFPDQMDTLSKYTANPMLYGKRTKRQTLNKILLLQNEFNKTVVEYIKRTEPKPPRPSRLKRQQKRQEKGLIQNWIDKKDLEV